MKKYRRFKSKALAVLLICIYLFSCLEISTYALTAGRYLADVPGDEEQSSISLGDDQNFQQGDKSEPPLLNNNTTVESGLQSKFTEGIDGEGGSGDENPIEFSAWYLGDGGVVTQDNQDWFCVTAYFFSIEEIEAIEYYFSPDGTTWAAFPSFYDYELREYDYTWYREIYVDMTDLDDGTYYLRAVASTVDNIYTLTEECTFLIDTTAPDVTGLTATTDESNSGVVLSWTNPDHDFEFARIFRWSPRGVWYRSSESEDYIALEVTDESEEPDIWASPDGSNGNWNFLEDTAGNTYTDYEVSPNTTYYYMVLAYDEYVCEKRSS